MPLFDRFGRIHNYMRISLTDQCNMRCTYCMPHEQYDFLPASDRMSPAEIEGLAAVFIQLGIDKVRLTGGEPLFRRDFPDILDRLSRFSAELMLSTNGALIHRYINVLKESPLRKINLSLDALNEEDFYRITQRKDFTQVWSNLHLLLKEGFRVKVNAVATMENIPSQLLSFIELTRDHDLHIRFIEYMPFDRNGWSNSKVIATSFMLDEIRKEYDIVKLQDEPHATAKKFKVIGHKGTFAFITTMTEPFCGDCNRLRLTADGKVKNCLFGRDELDLLGPYRRGEDVESIIRHSLQLKHAVMGGQFPNDYRSMNPAAIENRSMINIGG
jgi:cyclic pyranopterin phosphate synthase